MRREETSSLTPLSAAIQMWPLAVSQQPIKTTPDQPRPSLLEQKQKESLLGDVLVDQAQAHLLVPVAANPALSSILTAMLLHQLRGSCRL